MKPSDLIPNFIKLTLKKTYNCLRHSSIVRKITVPTKDVDELHRYWKQPWDGANLPQSYLEGEARSQLMVDIVRKYADPNSRILEIGCNVGRNLNYLFLDGFRNLVGIEISEKAVELLKQAHPEMAKSAVIYNASVETIIKDFKDGEFDIVLTMAVLEHIHKDSEWIFPEIVRITKHFIITIEDEMGISWRHFPRNYKRIFSRIGTNQIEEINCRGVENLSSNFFARVFKKI